MIELIFTLLIIVGWPLAMFLASASTGKARRARLEAWQDTMKRMGLTASSVDSSTVSFPVEHDGLQVSLVLREGEPGEFDRLTVAMPPDGYVPTASKAFAALNPELSIYPWLLSGGHGLECGDQDFNQALVVNGDEVRCAAALDHATRLSLLRCLARRSFEVKNGQVSCMVQEALSEAEAKSVADTLLEVARLLRMSAASFPERLLSTARSDPVPRVRTRAIAALIVGFGERPETADALRIRDQGGIQERFLRHLEEEPRSQGVVFHALSKVGTLASVGRLLELKGDSDTDYFRNVCVDAIQKRLGTGEQGWLSLAAPDADQGALSTADEGSTLAIAESEER